MAAICSETAIPDVCEALKIRCVNMLQLFRDQRWILG
ncbi:MAG: DUF4411 family protein [Desulfomonilaceae bacterium]